MPYSRYRQDYINAWKRAHPERRREWHRRDRLAKYRPQYNEQDGLCYWCGEELGDTYTADHLLPRRLGGYDNPENIVLACRSCNSSRRCNLDWRPTRTYSVPIYVYW